MVVVPRRANNQGYRSIYGSDDRVETKGRAGEHTNGRTGPILLSCSLTRSAKVIQQVAGIKGKGEDSLVSANEANRETSRQKTYTPKGHVG